MRACQIFQLPNQASTDPDATHPESASPSYSTREAYSKTHPAATQGRPPYVAWCNTNSIIPDPYNPQDFDRYSYVRNDPVNRNDPSGHCSLGGHWEDDSSSACRGMIINHVYQIYEQFLELTNSPIHPKYPKNHLQTGYYSWLDNRGSNHANYTGIGGNVAYHPALDITLYNVNLGDPIYPMYPGEVIFAGWDTFGFGNAIIIHSVYEGVDLYSVYAHEGTGKDSSINGINVKVGDHVETNTQIGTVGYTKDDGKGNFIQGPIHLHVEVRTALSIDLASPDPLATRNYWVFGNDSAPSPTWSNYFLNLGAFENGWPIRENTRTAKWN